MAELRRVPRERIDELVEALTMPSFERMLADGRVERMRDSTAREGVRRTVAAAAELQQDGVEPTDVALHARGGLRPDSTQRLLARVDLSSLAAEQAETAVEQRYVRPPWFYVVEAHTERTMGPEKFGTDHPLPPEGLDLGPSREGARHVKGGIASVVTVTETDGTVLTLGSIPLAQGHFDPQRYPENLREELVEQLRYRTGNLGEFITEPAQVAEQLGEFIIDPAQVAGELVAVGSLPAWMREIGKPVVLGGRLRMGQPIDMLSSFGAGTRERYLGCHVDALQALMRKGLIPFFEMPIGVRAGHLIEREQCEWAFHFGGRRFGLEAVVDLVHEQTSPWRPVEPEVIAAIVPTGLMAQTLRTRVSTVSGREFDVTLILVYTVRGEMDVFVTTLPEATPEDRAALVTLAAAERARRAPGSALSVGVRALLEDGHLQRTKRRRYLERQSFAGVAHAAFNILELGRRTAA